MFKITPTLSEPTYEGFIDPTGDGLEMAILECMDEHGFIVTEASAVMGSVKGKATAAWEKIVQFLKDLKARAIAWFHAVIQRIQGLFRVKSAFVKKHSETLLNKNSADFVYTAYPYQLVAGAEKTQEMAEELAELMATVSAENASRGEIEKFLARKKIDSFDEMMNKLRKTYRGGEKEIEIKGFSATSVKGMLDELAEADKSIADLKKDLANFEKRINNTIKDLERGKEDTVDGEIVRISTVMLNLARTSADVYVEGVNSFHKTLSAFLAYKPNTKSDDKVTESAEELLYNNW